jgi:hypothetical protein
MARHDSRSCTDDYTTLQLIFKHKRQNFQLGTYSSPEETSPIWEDEILT